jgi:hypothetical protein
MLEANSNPPAMVRPKAAVATLESPWRWRASSVIRVLTTPTTRMPPSAAVARIS